MKPSPPPKTFHGRFGGIACNPNWLGLALVLVAFGLSCGQVFQHLREGSRKPDDGGKRIVRLLHWQLEPGYREALEKVIQRYNQLPQVQAARVEVRQMYVADRVYSQFLNVHLISGTAPDLSVRRSNKVVRTGTLGKFYESLGDRIADPNPYNHRRYTEAPEYQAWRASVGAPPLDPEFLAELEQMPWRSTFIDNMKNGYDDGLKDYFAVPASTFGMTRLYYNRKLLQQIKAYLAGQWSGEPRPTWLKRCLQYRADGEGEGYLPESPGLHAWVQTEEPPQTLGQFLLYCEAVRWFAQSRGDDKLVAISGSERIATVFRDYYLGPFTISYANLLDWEWNYSMNEHEVWTAWMKNRWSYQDKPLRDYFACVRAIASHFPPGFLGLDRDQANRRFVSGQAAMIAAGGWDAASLFRGAQEKSDPRERFTVGVMRFPLPGPGERWSETVQGRHMEGDYLYGVPYGVFKQSPNKEWAIDFMRFLSSLPQNEFFTYEAGWLPFVVGAHPHPTMRELQPDPDGFPVGYKLDISNDATAGQVVTVFKGQFWLYLQGELSYEEFVAKVESAYQQERSGLRRIWYNRTLGDQQDFRGKERGLSAMEMEYFFGQGTMPQEISRYRILLLDSFNANNGSDVRMLWKTYFPGEPFPEF